MVGFRGNWIYVFAVSFILLSRHKIQNKFLKGITALVAYTLMVVSGIVIFLVVFSGPVQQ